MERLSGQFHLLAPDSLNAGKRRLWQKNQPVTLADEAGFLKPVFAAAGDPFRMVGHSYGAAVALTAALARPGRLRALALYEPTLFLLLEEETPGHEAAQGIRDVVSNAAAAIDRHERAEAAHHFIDYGMNAGAWGSMPVNRQGPIADSMVHVMAWALALFGDRTPLEAFRLLDIPVLCMVGGQSPASSRRVTHPLTKVLPQVTQLDFPQLSHMGPVTHPEVVNEAIAAFFART